MRIPHNWHRWIRKGLHGVYLKKAQIPDQAMQTEEASRREVRAQEEEEEEQGGDNTLVVVNNQVKTTI